MEAKGIDGFTGSGGTGKLVIDIDGSLQPGISGFTDADGNIYVVKHETVDFEEFLFDEKTTRTAFEKALNEFLAEYRGEE